MGLGRQCQLCRAGGNASVSADLGSFGVSCPPREGMDGSCSACKASSAGLVPCATPEPALPALQRSQLRAAGMRMCLEQQDTELLRGIHLEF